VIVVGELSLWIALLMAAWCATVSFAGGIAGRADLIRSGERSAYAAFGFTVLAALGLWTALLTREFSLQYVASQISANMPNVYVFTAFWSGQAGSLLFWALILAIYSAITVWANRSTNRPLMPFVTGTLAVVLLFFLAVTAFRANPFTRLDWVPPDGRGMNPQLQNPGMAAHPPMLYLGYVATSIPFAFAIAALATRRLDAEWLAVVRRWSLVSWVFLTVGIVMGMWWAYVELGWGGYWAWDPVENSSFLPWLTGTAFLHSIMVQEKRGMLRKWNVTLVVVTFLLSILGTFITRSGIIESVHSFAQSPVGGWFAGFLLAASVLTAWLVTTRLKDLEARAELESMVSREAAFLYNNLLFLGITFSVLWGTLFPILSEWVRGTKITVGPPFFNTVNVPLGLLLLALTGIGPLIAWRRASLNNLRRQFLAPVLAGVLVAALLFAVGMRHVYALVTYLLAGFVAATIVQEFWKGIGARRSIHGEAFATAFVRLIARNRRRYGGYIVHAGIVMMFAAFAGLAFRSEHDVSLGDGQAFEITDPYGRNWRFVSQGVSTSESLNREITAVSLETWLDGRNIGLIKSEKRQYFDSGKRPTFEPTTEVGIRSDARLDTYIVLAGVRDEAAELRITFNPLVLWVWLGGGLLALGGVIVMWPQAERRRQAGYATKLRPAAEPEAEPVGAA
jgi:cytochrome c-type biogenesis protein CcmF